MKFVCSSRKVSIEGSDPGGQQMELRKIGTMGKDFGRCRKVQKRVLGGEGLTRVGWDGSGSILDAELRFAKLHFDDSCALREQDSGLKHASLRAEPRLRRPPCPAGWF